MSEAQLSIATSKGPESPLQKASGFIFGVVLIGLVILIVCFAFRGMVWASEKALPWIIKSGQITVAVCGFVFLPFCILKRTRVWAGFGFFLASYVFGTELFAYSCIFAFYIWGYLGLVLGLILGGVGIVPVALLATFVAALQHRTQWDTLGGIVEMILLTFGTRFLGVYLVEKYQQR